MKYVEANNFNIVSPTEARSIIVAYDQLNNGGLKTLANTGTFSTSFGDEFDIKSPLESINLTQTTWEGKYCLIVSYSVVFGNKENKTSTSNSSHILLSMDGEIIARYFVLDEEAQKVKALQPLHKLTGLPKSQLTPSFIFSHLAKKSVKKYINWLIILRNAYGMKANKLTKSPTLKLHFLLKEMMEDSIHLINYQAYLTEEKSNKQKNED